MYDEKIEALISAALADGVLTEKEKQVLFKRAQAEGIDLDEFEMVLDARLVELQKAEEAKAKEEKDKSAPKSTKYGDVRKCPVCGAMVPALAGACPECGYEFSGVDANLSSQILSDKLITIERECEAEKKREHKKDEPILFPEKVAFNIKWQKTLHQRKRTLIETFPIPNTKSDLFEFITSLLPKINDRNLGNAYRAKVEECILKANSLFPNESIFEKLTANAKLSIQKQKRHNFIMVFCVVFIVIIAIGTPIIWGVTHTKLYNQKQIDKYINSEQPEKAVKYCLRDYEGSHGDQTRVSEALANAGKVDDAITLYLVHHNKKDLGDFWQTPSPEAIRKALIKEKRYEEALEFSNRDTYGMTLLWILEDLCNDGKKQEARRFLKTQNPNAHIDTYYDDLWHKYSYKGLSIEKLLEQYIDGN